MKVRNMAQLREFVDPPPSIPTPAAPAQSLPSSELLSAIRELAAASKERPVPVVQKPLRWIFKVRRDIEGLVTEIVAEAQ